MSESFKDRKDFLLFSRISAVYSDPVPCGPVLLENSKTLALFGLSK